jgi:hypothetical protein
MKVFIAALLLLTLQCSCAVSPTDCNDIEPVAEEALDLINKGRWNGYLFQLLRVSDAHLDSEVRNQWRDELGGLVPWQVGL